MTQPDDRWWDDVVAEVDLDVGDLAAAEARLEAGADAPLARGQAAVLVAKVTRKVPELRLVEPAAPKPRRRRAVAVVLGGMLLAAAGYFLIWQEQRLSRETMSYKEALRLLESPEQPEDHRRTAMGRIAMRIDFGIRELRALQDTQASGPLGEGARQGLQRLLMLLTVEPPQRLGANYENLKLATDRARDSALGMDVRGRELERVILAVGSDIGELRCMPDLTPTHKKDRDTYFASFRLLLSR